MKTTIAIIAAVTLAACAAPVEAPAPALETTKGPDAPQGSEPEGTFTVPTETEGLGEGQSPGADFDRIPSWSVDPDTCASPKFVKSVPFVVDNSGTSTKSWSTNLVLVPEGAFPGVPGATDAAKAAAMCAGSQYPGVHLPSTAEVLALTTAVAGCPLPGAFYGVDLWTIITSDGCVDLKNPGAAVGHTCAQGVTIPEGPLNTPTFEPLSRAVLCVK